MMKSVTIGEHELNLLANAATPILYRNTFGGDLMKSFTKATQADGESEAIEIIPKLTFILEKQAQGLAISEFQKITENEYINWLCQFDAFDFVNNAGKIIEVYMANRKTASASKKKVDR